MNYRWLRKYSKQVIFLKKRNGVEILSPHRSRNFLSSETDFSGMGVCGGGYVNNVDSVASGAHWNLGAGIG